MARARGKTRVVGPVTRPALPRNYVAYLLHWLYTPMIHITLVNICQIPTYRTPLLALLLAHLNTHKTRKCGNYSDVLPLKAARRDSINSEGG